MPYEQLLNISAVDGAALTNSTAATSLLPLGVKIPWVAGLLRGIPQDLRVFAAGRISTLATTPGTLTLDLRLVSAGGTVVIANGGTMVLSTTTKTNVAWKLDWELTLRSIGGGTAATLMHQGVWTSEAAGATTVAGEAKSIMLPQSAPAVGTGFDETAVQTIDLFATWSSASTSSSIQCHQFKVRAAVPQ